jgi:pyruvate kinase
MNKAMPTFPLGKLRSDKMPGRQVYEEPSPATLNMLLSVLTNLLQTIESNGQQRIAPYAKYFDSPVFTPSALNLAHYLAFRQIDLRDLQERLAETGLSSLGRAEPAVKHSIMTLISLLHRALGKKESISTTNATSHDIKSGRLTLEKHTEQLLGKYREHHSGHIMVTLDADAAWNYPLIKDLLLNGMTCARINCAHDDAASWLKLIGLIRQGQKDTGLSCKILMDLAGHKVRTGSIVPEQAVHHIKVKKDRSGKVIASGYLVLTTEPENESIDTDLFTIRIPDILHKKLTSGLFISFIDKQEKQRYLKIEKALSNSAWLVSCDKTAYLPSNCPIKILNPDYSETNRRNESYVLGKFDGKPLDIRLFPDENLLLTSNTIPGRPAEYSDSGVLVRPAHIGCTLASAINRLKVGDPVWIDDGKLGAVVEQITDQGALLRVTYAKTNGIKIQSGKGINFPNTDLQLPPLSNKDIKDLDFVCKHADLVGFSFVETLADVNKLKQELNKRKTANLPIILKIESNRAVKNLPDILLGTMARHRLGVMIARGDLAVELGSDRLAEIQEEILWLCEAAHTPVIWATQVLESITKKGVRSRPEFTDAAMAARAECVMLNKGPHIIDAIIALVNVMTRMENHQHKKFSRLRALHW